MKLAQVGIYLSLVERTKCLTLFLNEEDGINEELKSLVIRVHAPCNLGRLINELPGKSQSSGNKRNTTTNKPKQKIKHNLTCQWIRVD